MIKMSLQFCKLYKPLQQLQSIQLSTNIVKRTCLCGNIYFNNTKYNMNHIRVHSTQSDQHRQKVVIDTTPSIDKLDIEKRVKLFWRERIDPYIKLTRWDKPIGIYLLFWPGAWGIALASVPGTVPPATTLYTAALFLAGAGLMRGAGCTINDLWDRDIDSQICAQQFQLFQVERTRNRPLVSGALTARQAVGALAVQLALALGVLFQLNCYSVVLGASSLLLVVTYPLAKRFTNYPQIFLGATFNWGALLGYSAIQGSVEPAVCLPLYVGALAWTVLYDTIYAHQDKLDDARIGIKSTALTFGARTKPALCCALAASAAGLWGAGAAAGLHWPAAAAAAAAAHAARQIYTLDPDNPADCASKFNSNSTVGLIVLLCILGGGYTQYMENRAKHKGKEDLSVTKSCLFG